MKPLCSSTAPTPVAYSFGGSISATEFLLPAAILRPLEIEVSMVEKYDEVGLVEQVVGYYAQNPLQIPFYFV